MEDGGIQPPSGAQSPPPDGGSIAPPPPTSAPLSSMLADEGLRTHQGLTKFKDVDALAKSYLEVQALKDKNTGVKPLGENATPEEIAAYRQGMGVPDAPEKYEFGELQFPEAVAPTQEQLNSWRQTFHALHLTPQQVQGIMQAYAGEMSQNWTTLEAAQTDEVRQQQEALQQKYGAQWVPMVKMAQESIRRVYGEEALESLNFAPGQEKAMGNNPVVIDMAIKLARYEGHDKFIIADSKGALLDREGAESQLRALYARRLAAKDDGERAAINEEIKRLQPLA
jgi:hypothetical protein